MRQLEHSLRMRRRGEQRLEGGTMETRELLDTFVCAISGSGLRDG